MDFRYIKSFSRRTKLSKDAYDKVVARWKSLASPAKPPRSRCSRMNSLPTRSE